MKIYITLYGAAWFYNDTDIFSKPLTNLPYLYDWEDTSFRLFYH